MTIDRRVLGGALATALLLAACGGSASPAPSAAASAASVPAASDQPSATDQASASDQPSATDNGSAPNVSLSPGSAPELEAMLPSTVNGVAFARTSFGGAAMPAGMPIGSGDLATFLQQNGKTLADVNIAMATPTDTAKAATFVMAFQVKGVDGAKLADALGATTGNDLTKATVGGKQVLQAGISGMGVVLYVKGDVVFYILALGETSLTDGILAALP
jgi:hypothetical protein